MCSNESYAPVCSSQERICRTFVVEDEEGNELRRFQINIAQFLSSNDVNISSIFSLMTMKGLSTAGKDYFIPLLNISYSVGQATLIIPLSELQEKKISVVEPPSNPLPQRPLVTYVKSTKLKRSISSQSE
mgnify:CR=1 FL=1